MAWSEECVRARGQGIEVLSTQEVKGEWKGYWVAGYCVVSPKKRESG
jgi:hypothetical protein